MNFYLDILVHKREQKCPDISEYISTTTSFYYPSKFSQVAGSLKINSFKAGSCKIRGLNEGDYYIIIFQSSHNILMYTYI